MSTLPPSLGSQIDAYLRAIVGTWSVAARNKMFNATNAHASATGQLMADLTNLNRTTHPASRLPQWLNQYSQKPTQLPTLPTVYPPFLGGTMPITHGRYNELRRAHAASDANDLFSLRYNTALSYGDLFPYYETAYDDDLEGDIYFDNEQEAKQLLIDNNVLSRSKLAELTRKGVDPVVLWALHKHPYVRSLMTLLMTSATETPSSLEIQPVAWILPGLTSNILQWSEQGLLDFVKVIGEDQDVPEGQTSMQDYNTEADQMGVEIANTIMDQPVPTYTPNPLRNFRSYPGLTEAIRAMQSPMTLALLSMTLFRIVYTVSSTAVVYLQLKVLTKRTRNGNGQHSFRVLSLPIQKNQGILISASSTLSSVLETIVGAMEQIMTGTGQTDSDWNELEDEIIVLGLKYRFADNIQPTPLIHHNLHYLPPAEMKKKMRMNLAALRAFGYPKKLFNDGGRLTIPLPPAKTPHCILYAFGYIRLIASGQFSRRADVPPRDRVTHNAMLASTLQEFVSDMRRESPIYEAGGLMECLESLLEAESRWFEPHDQTGIVYLVFFAGYGRCPPLPSIKLSYADGEFDIQVPANHQFFFSEEEVSDLELILVYFQGHLLPSTMGQFRACINQDMSEYIKINTASNANPPDPYELKPMRLERLQRRQAQLDAMEQASSAVRSTKSILSKFVGCPETLFRLDKLSADFETGHCSECSSAVPYNVQDAFAASIAWGTGELDVVNFSGHECPQAAAQSTFETYDGCVTQMLRWMKKHWGWYRMESDRQRKPCKVITRWIYFFNGARFDLFFLFKTLNFWHEPVDIIQLGSQLIKLTWGNYVFCDFAQLYPHCSLDECYEIFRSTPQADIQQPKTGKWKAFPYGLICSGMFGRSFIPLEELAAQDECWGGKRAKVPGMEEASIGACNAAYWAANIRADGMYVREDLENYCAEDVRILQYCVIVHTKYLATGLSPRGVYFNTNRALTCSSAAFEYFRQAYLQDTFISPVLSQLQDIVDPRTGHRVHLANLFKDSLHGGKTECFYHTMEYTPAQKEALKQLGYPTPLYDDHDFNSKYPHIMNTHDIPMVYDGVELFTHDSTRPVRTTTFKKHYLYNASIQYPPKGSGIIAKVCGYCVAVNYLPLTYDDPKDSTRSIFNMVWGVELQEAVRQGAQVHVRFCLRFHAVPLFKEFISDTYQQRVSTKNAAVKMVLKLTMNGTAGKLAQAAKATSVIIMNMLDDPLESVDDTLISLDELPAGLGDHQALLAKVLQRRSHIGQFNFANSYITAAARADICHVIYEMEHRCIDLLGLPVRAGYCDTDSIKSTYFDYSATGPACNREFAKEFIHPTELGKLKSETQRTMPDGRVCQGLDLLVMLRKKVGVMHLYDPDNPLPADADVSALEVKDKSFVCKSKGLPHKVVLPSDLMNAHLSREKKTFQMPMNFRRSLTHGITKSTDETRSVQTGNGCRMGPDEDGFLLPFPTLEAFIQSMTMPRMSHPNM